MNPKIQDDPDFQAGYTDASGWKHTDKSLAEEGMILISNRITEMKAVRELLDKQISDFEYEYQELSREFKKLHPTEPFLDDEPF